jgi:hypothetical protein
MIIKLSTLLIITLIMIIILIKLTKGRAADQSCKPPGLVKELSGLRTGRGLRRHTTDFSS